MPTFRLTPYATFLENRLFPHTVQYGIFHQLTGVSLAVSPELRSLLEKMQAGRELVCDDEELQRRKGTELCELIDHQLLVPPDHDAFAGFEDYLVVRPKQNPAVFYRTSTGTITAIRIPLSQRVFSPSRTETPVIIEEELSEVATKLLLLADGSKSFREIRTLLSANLSQELFPETVNHLVAPDRQLIKLAPPGSALDEPFLPFNTVPRNLMVSKEGEPHRDIQDPKGVLEFHQHQIADAEREFDWIEATVNHAFRNPSAAFGGLSYGARFCDATLRQEVTQNTASNRPLQMLEVGGGTGSFGRSFLDRAEQAHGGIEIIYHLLELSPVLFNKQTDVIGGRLTRERHFLQDARQLNLPEHRFDLIIANEVIADFPVAEVQRLGENSFSGTGAEDTLKYSLPKSGDPDQFLINKGVFEFVERAFRHLSPGGTIIMSEYGGVDRFPVRSYHLNHAEYSIHFGHVLRCAETVGFTTGVFSLKGFLSINDEVEFLDGQEEHILCLHHALEKFGSSLPYAAISKEEFEVRYERIIVEKGLGGFSFSKLKQDFHFGPTLGQFMVAVLQKPLECGGKERSDATPLSL